MDITTIVNKIKKEGGFELYAPADGRRDINDTFDGGVVYVRAFHNIKYPVKTKIKRAIKTEEHKSLERALFAYKYGEPESLDKNYEIVLHGSFPGYNTTLNQLLIRTQSNKQAYFIKLEIKAEVEDHVGRTKGPILTIIAKKDLINQIINYLAEKPSDYYGLINMLMPKDENYKNVNAHILDIVKPTESFLLLDMDEVLTRMRKDFKDYDKLIHEHQTNQEEIEEDEIDENNIFELNMKTLDEIGGLMDISYPTFDYSDHEGVQKKYGRMIIKQKSGD